MFLTERCPFYDVVCGVWSNAGASVYLYCVDMQMSIETRRRLPLLRTQDNHYWRGLGADSTSDSLSTLLSASAAAASVVSFYLTTFPPSVNNMAANKEVWLSIRKLRSLMLL